MLKDGYYRNISVCFWTDSKVDDDMTPEDKYFYLYLLTNPHTSLSGCYEISMKQMKNETGYNEDTVSRLLKRMENEHNVIRYNKESKEVLILNWHKYNWSTSEKLLIGVRKELPSIKCNEFRAYIEKVLAGEDTVSIPYTYDMDTSVTVTVTDSVTDTDAGSVTETGRKKRGEYGWVLLTDEQYSKLLEDLGPEELQRCITYVDESAQSNGNKNKWKDWNLVIRKCSKQQWGVNRYNRQENTAQMLHDSYDMMDRWVESHEGE